MTEAKQAMNMTDLAFLQWSDFQENRSTYFQNARSSLEFSDVTLACEDNGGFIEAHRFVLASESSFFQRLLSSSRTSQHPYPLIFLTGMLRNHLEAVVDFLYMGECRVEQTNLLDFLQAAQTLGVTGLLQQNNQRTSNENVCDIEKVADHNKTSQHLVVKEEMEHINTNMLTLIGQEDFETTSKVSENLQHAKENIYHSKSLDLNLDYSKMDQTVTESKAIRTQLPGSRRRASYWSHFSMTGKKATCLLGGCKTPLVSLGKDQAQGGKAGGRANNFSLTMHLRRNHKETWMEYEQEKEGKTGGIGASQGLTA